MSNAYSIESETDNTIQTKGNINNNNNNNFILSILLIVVLHVYNGNKRHIKRATHTQ